jgi:hypothetical protein
MDTCRSQEGFAALPRLGSTFLPLSYLQDACLLRGTGAWPVWLAAYVMVGVVAFDLNFSLRVMLDSDSMLKLYLRVQNPD